MAYTRVRQNTFFKRIYRAPKLSLFFCPLCLTLLTVTLLTTGCLRRSDNPLEWESYSKHLRQAERFQRKENYDKAISAYKAHVKLRLETEEKPEWENPYFYYLLIGDLYLKQEKLEEALESYTFARKMEVDIGLVSDRYRLVANFLAKQEKHKEAIDLLNLHRDIDPLLYDMMRDRIAREMVLGEEQRLLTPPK